jgi:serine/threonine protein kinase
MVLPRLMYGVVRAADLSYAAKDEWEVERDTVELISQLGEGQYGEVYKGQRRQRVVETDKS